MHLYYRGVQYDADPSVVETVQSPTSGKYRGARFSFRIPRQKLPNHGTLRLSYRGAAYEAHL
jgi:hypothetical protein